MMTRTEILAAGEDRYQRDRAANIAAGRVRERAIARKKATDYRYNNAGRPRIHPGDALGPPDAKGPVGVVPANADEIDDAIRQFRGRVGA